MTDVASEQRSADCVCGAPRARTARYCTNCGRPTARIAQELRENARRDARAVLRAVLAIGIGFAGFFPAMLALGELTADESGWSGVVAIACCGVASLAVAGGGWRAATPLRIEPKWCAAGLPIGAFGVACAVGYVWLLVCLGVEPESEFEPSVSDATLVLMVLTTVVGVPLVEEWFVRGVLWAAMSRVASPTVVVVATAALFGLMHGVNGAFLAEVPHRFVGGLLLGWLRLRSGSLVPCVVAHMTWNGLAVALPSSW